MTEAQILEQLRTVNDPELHKDLVSLNMVKGISIKDNGIVAIAIELTTPACPLKDQIRRDIESAVRQLGEEVQGIEIEFTANVQASPQQKAAENNPLPGVKNIVAVGAGKGGVGKSTVAVNLAVGLARQGASVGLMDGDIYGPSLPTMLGLDKHTAHMSTEKRIVPFGEHGIKSMTIGKLVDPGKALIWRGPMAHGAFQRLATQTDWGDLDYLIIDLPPGTGDVPLTMSQILPLAGAVVVCTPQKVAQDDARRAIAMFQQLNIAVLGVVENMSYFIGDDGKEYDIFGRDGAQAMAQELNIPVLGAIPINMALRRNSDSGDPTSNFTGDGKLAEELEVLVKNFAARISVEVLGGDQRQPTLTISG